MTEEYVYLPQGDVFQRIDIYHFYNAWTAALELTKLLYDLEKVSYLKVLVESVYDDQGGYFPSLHGIEALNEKMEEVPFDFSYDFWKERLVHSVHPISTGGSIHSENIETLLAYYQKHLEDKYADYDYYADVCFDVQEEYENYLSVPDETTIYSLREEPEHPIKFYAKKLEDGSFEIEP